MFAKNHKIIDKSNPDFSKLWNNLNYNERRKLLIKSHAPERLAMVSFGNMAFDDDSKQKVIDCYKNNYSACWIGVTKDDQKRVLNEMFEQRKYNNRRY